MSKGLEALQFMRERDMFLQSCANTIEKELKALEIIKSKEVSISYFKIGISLEHWNETFEKKYRLTQEEYDLLKEVLL